MSSWFSRTSVSQPKENEDTEKTVIVSADTNTPDKIVDVLKEEGSTQNPETINVEKTTTTTIAEQEENSEDKDDKVQTTENPEFFKLGTESTVYCLVRNHCAVGYSKTRQEALDNMHNLAQELLETYEEREPYHAFYLRITSREEKILVMAEDSYLAFIKHGRVRDELKIVEIPEILGADFEDKN